MCMHDFTGWITRLGLTRASLCVHALQISVVVYAFKYPARTALAVGLSMAQIGEFAFVLLSVASQLGLLPYQVYMLLMGARAPSPSATQKPAGSACLPTQLSLVLGTLC